MVADVMESTIGCKDVCRIVEEYLAGTLDANTQKAIDDHLVTCQACQDEVDIALEIFSVLQDENYGERHHEQREEEREHEDR